MMLEVHVRRGDDHQIILVLNIGEFSLEVSFSIVVNEADRTGHALRAEFLRVIEQLFAGHLGDRVRAVGQLAAHHHIVEFIEQIRRQRHAETGNFGGGRSGHGVW